MILQSARPHRVRTTRKACADSVCPIFSAFYIYSPHSPHIYNIRERLASLSGARLLCHSLPKSVRTVRIVRTSR